MNNKVYVLEINGMSIQYIVKRNRSKYVKISIDVNGLKVSAPKTVTLTQIESILIKKSKWLLEKYTKYINDKKIREINASKELKKILLMGEEIDIKVSEWENESIEAVLCEKQLQINIPNGIDNLKRKNYIEEAIRKCYVELAKTDIERKAKYYSKVMGVNYNLIKIKDQKTRWGSCSSKRNLNFNWRLIMFPEWVMIYVIIHELCHLIYLNHSKEYWKLVSNYMPNYKEAHKWLKENGKILSAGYNINTK